MWIAIGVLTSMATAGAVTYEYDHHQVSMEVAEVIVPAIQRNMESVKIMHAQNRYDIYAIQLQQTENTSYQRWRDYSVLPDNRKDPAMEADLKRDYEAVKRLRDNHLKKGRPP